MKLHIGGQEAKPGWHIFNIQDGPNTDFVGDVTDLSQFADSSIEEIYASHIFEHLAYRDELPQALRECRRVLTVGGALKISVPNLGVLCQLFVADGLETKQRFELMRMIFGGQIDAHDFHKVGLIEEFLADFMRGAGFNKVERVETFGLFADSSEIRLAGHLISLNMIATK